jgi:hypothetical protein
LTLAQHPAKYEAKENDAGGADRDRGDQKPAEKRVITHALDITSRLAIRQCPDSDTPRSSAASSHRQREACGDLGGVRGRIEVKV